MILNPKDIERFRRRFVEASPDECWIWQGQTRESGYGVMRLGKTHVRAHRIAYEYYRGPIPEGLIVMHACDNRLCVNPQHLELGTNADNTHDMIAKGRHPTMLASKKIIRRKMASAADEGGEG